MIVLEALDAGSLRGMMWWAAWLRIEAGRLGRDDLAKHAGLLEDELRILIANSSDYPPEALREKVRLLHMELNWIQTTLISSRK